MNKNCTITCFFCVCHLFALCQDISGFWKGTLDMENGCFSVNNIELQIAIKEDTLTGNSYHYSDVDNYVKKKFLGSYNLALKKLTLQERAVTTLKIPLQCKVCIKEYELNYS